MFRRWAEGRMYRQSLRLAVMELRRAARTANALEKLRSLEVAEQKLRDAAWLRPDVAGDRFETVAKEVSRSRRQALRELALPAVGRLLEAAEQGMGERASLLAPAGELLAYLQRYLPEEPAVVAQAARYRELGGEPRPYQPVRPLSEMYHRPPGGTGCLLVVAGGLALAALALLARAW